MEHSSKSGMTKGRMEAFSDGVIAIIITIMVLELKVPHGDRWEDLAPLWPVLLAYVLSFVNVGIYWINHHHLLQLMKAVDARILWSNMFHLFWLSLMPATTAWMGDSHFAAWPTAIFGIDLVLCGLSFTVLTLAIIRSEGTNSHTARLMGRGLRGKLSLLVYLLAIPLAFSAPVVSVALYFAVALSWFMPDSRAEALLRE